MNCKFVNKNNNPRVLLIFAGWGMDDIPFRHLHHEGYDIAVIYDYTTENFDCEPLKSYREVVVIAWSMGVFEASRLLPVMSLPLTLTVAVNGTMKPVDDSCGIPVDVFNATLNALSPSSLIKFNRRMCGSSIALQSLNAHAPQRTLDSLKEELKIIGSRALNFTPFKWDVAIISSGDMIFPAANQRRAWEGSACIEVDGPHLPDFQSIANRFLIDKNKVAKRFGASRTCYDSEALNQHAVARRLVNLLVKSPIPLSANSIIEIGAGSGTLTHLYTPLFRFNRLELWDIAPGHIDNIPPGALTVTDDAEARLRTLTDNSIDILLSASTLQWFNSPLRAITEIYRILKPGATAALAIYVAGTFRSVAAETGATLNYVEPSRLIDALPRDRVKIHHSIVEENVETFDSTRQLFEHLRSTGVNALNSSFKIPLSKLKSNSLTRLEYTTLYLIFSKL